MQKEFENNIPFDLISKVISGEASEEEVTEVKDWRNVNEANEKEYQNLAQIMGEVPASVPEIDVNKAWNKVDSKIGGSNAQNPKSKNNNFRIFKLAAVACIALVALFLLPNEEQDIEFVAQNDGERLYLPDGSEITLKKGTSINYLADFGEINRTIEFKGEAFFKIKRDTTRRFTITMNGPTVQVLGTSFNIKTDSLKTEVVVNSGKVAFSPVDPRFNKVKKTVMKKGDAAVYDVKSHQIEEVKGVDPATLFYATKTLVFKKTKMKEVAKVLSTVYNHNVVIGCESLEDEAYNGRIENKSLQEALYMISLTMEAKVEEVEGKLIFNQDACN